LKIDTTKLDVFLSGCVAFRYNKWLMQCALLSSMTSSGTDPYYMSGFDTNCGGFVGEKQVLLLLTRPPPAPHPHTQKTESTFDLMNVLT
jgi:hypothetical protein